MRIRKYFLSFVVVAIAILVPYSLSLATDARPPANNIVVTVSEFKGAPSDIVKVPIYIAGTKQISVTEVSFSLKYPGKILVFKNLGTDFNTLLWNSNGSFEENRRQSLITASFDSPIPISKDGILAFVIFEVVGEKGSSGLIEITNFSLPQLPEVDTLIFNSAFRVLPTVTHVSDRDLLEITANEAFTSFELAIGGDVGLVQSQDTGWSVTQSNGYIYGASGSLGYGATSITLPVSEDSEFEIYSLKLDNEAEVVYQRRRMFLPFASD